MTDARPPHVAAAACGATSQGPAARVARVARAAAQRPARLRPVPGFERTAYAWHGRRLVWVGREPLTDHPRNLHSPWQPPAPAGDAVALRAAARAAIASVEARGRQHAPPGLLAWLAGGPLPFPMQAAGGRFGAVRAALEANCAQAFAAAAPALLGLGPGLTPSGDDFLGGIFFALAHAPRRGWGTPLAALKRRLREAARTATNPISAALLSDLMHGRGYRALHEWLAALQSGEPEATQAAAQALLRLGASSGADLMCGVLVALASTPKAPVRRPPARPARPVRPLRPQRPPAVQAAPYLLPRLASGMSPDFPPDPTAERPTRRTTA